MFKSKIKYLPKRLVKDMLRFNNKNLSNKMYKYLVKLI